jgi:hypothetical protein
MSQGLGAQGLRTQSTNPEARSQKHADAKACLFAPPTYITRCLIYPQTSNPRSSVSLVQKITHYERVSAHWRQLLANPSDPGISAPAGSRDRRLHSVPLPRLHGPVVYSYNWNISSTPVRHAVPPLQFSTLCCMLVLGSWLVPADLAHRNLRYRLALSDPGFHWHRYTLNRSVLLWVHSWSFVCTLAKCIGLNERAAW